MYGRAKTIEQTSGDSLMLTPPGATDSPAPVPSQGQDAAQAANDSAKRSPPIADERLLHAIAETQAALMGAFNFDNNTRSHLQSLRQSKEVEGHDYQ